VTTTSVAKGYEQISAEQLVDVRALTVEFDVAARSVRRDRKRLRAVDDVSFVVKRGETLGIVGESGSGKTTLGRTILGMHRPVAGTVLFDGQDVTQLSRASLKMFRRRSQMIFQDPYGSLDPRMRVGDIIAEPLVAQGVGSAPDRRRRVAQLLDLVGLPAGAAARYPHAFSGGQRQRIGIARALAVGPELIVADEPVSALDVSIQAQIVNLLSDLRQELDLTMIFIAHDLAVVRQVAHRVAVMYLGRIVELGDTENVLRSPRHPYTKSLLASVPDPDPVVAARPRRPIIQGEVPSPIDLPSGCRFHTRCPIAMPVCKAVDPRLITDVAGSVACHAIFPPDPAVTESTTPVLDRGGVIP
jgi:oligopeptide/dipeptide ABC transporter ATP-binding protein